MAAPRSRRDFLQLAGLTTAAAPAAFAIACGEDEERKRDPAAAAREDVKVLNAALDLEHTAVAAYSAGARLLRGDALRAGRQFLEHEREHARALARAIRDLGGTPNERKPAEEYARGFPTLRDQTDVLEFAVDLENVAVRAYVDSLPKLSDPKLRQAAAAIVATEAEHISVLLGALGKPQVPAALVTGRA